MRKSKITISSLKSEDYNRPQVQLPPDEAEAWAFGYKPLAADLGRKGTDYTGTKAEADKVRDRYGPELAEMALDAAERATATSFPHRVFRFSFYVYNVHPEVYERGLAYLRRKQKPHLARLLALAKPYLTASVKVSREDVEKAVKQAKEQNPFLE